MSNFGTSGTTPGFFHSIYQYVAVDIVRAAAANFVRTATAVELTDPENDAQQAAFDKEPPDSSHMSNFGTSSTTPGFFHSICQYLAVEIVRTAAANFVRAATAVELTESENDAQQAVFDKEPPDICTDQLAARVLVYPFSAPADLGESSHIAFEFTNSLIKKYSQSLQLLSKEHVKNLKLLEREHSKSLPLSKKEGLKSLQPFDADFLRDVQRIERTYSESAKRLESERSKNLSLFKKAREEHLQLLSHAISEQNDLVIQELIKKYIPETSAQDDISKCALNEDKLTALQKKQYVINSVQLLFQALSQHNSSKAIYELIKVCAHLFDQQKGEASDKERNIVRADEALLKDGLSSLYKKLRNTPPDHPSISSLIKELADLSEIKSEVNENGQNTDALAQCVDLYGKTQGHTIGSVGHLTRSAKHENEQYIDSLAESLDRYSEGLMLLERALSRKIDPAIQPLMKLCVDEYDRFAEDFKKSMEECSKTNNIPERLQNIAELILAPQEQYDSDVNMLEFAISRKHSTTLPTLVEISADSHKKNLLHDAAEGGFLGLVKTLIEGGVEKTVQDENGMTPLNYAARAGNLNVIKALFEGDKKFSPNGLINRNKETPVFLAAEYGHLEVVKFFVEKGANIHLTTSSGQTPYSIALEYGHFEVADFLKGKMDKKLGVTKSQSSQTYAQRLNAYMPEWCGYIYRA